MERAHTHYDNLKVTRNAPTEVIRAAYRVLAQKYHPDVNPSPDALRVMKIFNEAWDVLSNPTRRAEHDQWIVEQEKLAKSQNSFTNEYSFTADKEKYTYKHEEATSNWQKPTQSARTQNDTTNARPHANSASYSGTAPFENPETPPLNSLARLNVYLGSPYGVVYIGFGIVAILVLALVLIAKTTEIKKDSTSTDIAKPESSSPEQYSQAPPVSSSQAAPKTFSNEEALGAGKPSPDIGGPTKSGIDPLSSYLDYLDSQAEKHKTPSPAKSKPTDGSILDFYANAEASAPSDMDAILAEIHKPAKSSQISTGKENLGWGAYLDYLDSQAEKHKTPSQDNPITPSAKRAENGYLKGERQIFTGGLSSFAVDNSTGSHDAETRFYINGKQVRSMFVRIGTTFTANELAPGTYKMRYKMIINGKPRVFEAKEDFVLSETETETGTRFSRVRVTLYKVKNGNMQTAEIPLDRF